ncbi:hypothetical protein BB561_005581 [Smittium simulii]|uniref:TPR-like protein n=1 Tax=Smittium simulii TaxID=133385 RepID=A0A2T9Y9P3_9FUNG|nr:hypothetical protein BB561_005581 [Smittium simulii]
MQSEETQIGKLLVSSQTASNNSAQLEPANLNRVRRLRYNQEPLSSFNAFPSSPKIAQQAKHRFNSTIDSSYQSQFMQNLEQIRVTEHPKPWNSKNASSGKKYSRDSKDLTYNSNSKTSSIKLSTPTNNKFFSNRLTFSNSSLNNLQIVSPMINAREPYQTHITNTAKKPSLRPSTNARDSIFSFNENAELDSRSFLGFTPNNFYATPENNPLYMPPKDSFVKNNTNIDFCTPDILNNIAYQNNKLEQQEVSNSPLNLAQSQTSSEHKNYILAEILRKLAHHRASSFAFKSALHYYRLAYLFSKSESDLFQIVSILVQTGDYGQADYILFNNNIAINEFNPHFRVDFARLGIVISMRLNKNYRIGYLNKIIQKYQNSAHYSNAINSPKINNSSPNNFDSFGKKKTFNATSNNLKNNPLHNKFSNSANSSDLNYNVFISNLGLESERDFNPPENILKNTKTLHKISTNQSWDWYICGLSIFLSKSILGWESNLSFLENKYGSFQQISLGTFQTRFETPSNQISALNKKNKIPHSLNNNSIFQVVKSCWKESILNDPRCLEAWAALRNYGLLSVFEEITFIEQVDWASIYSENNYINSFFKYYTIVSGFPFSHHIFVQTAYNTLLSDYPQIRNDPNFKLGRAERFLTDNQPALTVACLQDSNLESVLFTNHYSSIDDGSTALMLVSWTQKNNKELIFAKAQYLIDYFGLSSILDDKNSYTNEIFALNQLNTNEYLEIDKTHCSNNSYQKSLETVWSILDSSSDPHLKPNIPNALRRLASIKSSSSAIRTGRNNCAIGVDPLNLSANTDSTSMYSNNLYGFKLSDGLAGEALCYFAIGCYYLTCLTKNQEKDIEDDEKELDYEFNGEFQKKNFASIIPIEKSLLEARRWFAKATIYAPQNCLSWLSFAYTFYLVYDYDRAIEATNSAVIASSPATNFSENISTSNELSFLLTDNTLIKNSIFGRNSHLPLLCLGTLYMCNSDLIKSERCFEASTYSLLNLDFNKLYNEHLITLLHSRNKSYSQNNSNNNTSNKSEWVFLACDVVLFNEIGVLKLKQNKVQEAIVWVSTALYCSIDFDKNKIINDQVTTFCLNLSHCFKTAGAYKKALKFANLALSFDPNNVDVLLTLAYLYYYLSLSLDNNSNDKYEDYDMFEDLFNDFEEIKPQKMVCMCIDICHQILYITPYNYIAAELLEMSLDHASSESFTSKISRTDMFNNSKETELKIMALDNYLSTITDDINAEKELAIKNLTSISTSKINENENVGEIFSEPDTKSINQYEQFNSSYLQESQKSHFNRYSQNCQTSKNIPESKNYQPKTHITSRQISEATIVDQNLDLLLATNTFEIEQNKIISNTEFTAADSLMNNSLEDDMSNINYSSEIIDDESNQSTEEADMDMDMDIEYD